MRHSLILSLLEQMVARLQSHIHFLKDGDANTTLFHSQTRRFRKKEKLYCQDCTRGEHSNFTDGQTRGVLQTFFMDCRDSNATVTYLRLAFIFKGKGLTILEEEVWQTIKSLPADNARWPDRYTGRFYKPWWQLIKVDVREAINTLQQGNYRKLWLLNSVYLTLIPKKDEAISTSDFRPVSLVHWWIWITPGPIWSPLTNWPWAHLLQAGQGSTNQGPLLTKTRAHGSFHAVPAK